MLAKAKTDAKSPRDVLACTNLPLVLTTVRKFRHELTDDDDLQDGAVAMLNAAGKYDPDRGVKFSTYSFRAIANATFRNYNSRRKVPTVGDMPECVVKSEINDWIEAEEAREVAAKALDQMNERERLVIHKRFFEGKTLLQVGAEIGVSKERVRQIALVGIRKAQGFLAQESTKAKAKANKEGQLASLDEQPLTACPYRSRELKEEWVNGWWFQRPPAERRSRKD